MQVGGGGEYLTENFFSLRNVPGVLKRGGRAGSENDTLLPMTMICDRLKFWSGPAWRSKVIIRKPWRRKNKKKKKKKKKKNSDKTICLISIIHIFRALKIVWRYLENQMLPYNS